MQSKIIDTLYNHDLIITARKCRDHYIKQGVNEHTDRINEFIERMYRYDGRYFRVTTVCGHSYEVDMIEEVSYFLNQIRTYIKDYYEACRDGNCDDRRSALKYFKEYLKIFWGQTQSNTFDSRGRGILYKSANALCWEVAGNDKYMENIVIRTFCRRFHRIITKELIRLGHDPCEVL